MKINIKRINVWGDNPSFPEFVELLVDENSVYEGPGDSTINTFVEGFVCGIESLGHDFDYSVEDMDE